MSKRLGRYQSNLAEKSQTEAALRVELFRLSYCSFGGVTPEQWTDLFSSLLETDESVRGLPYVDAWFHIARVLFASTPDPRERFYGIALAAKARAVGIRYNRAEQYAALIRALAGTVDFQMESVDLEDRVLAMANAEYVSDLLDAASHFINVPLEDNRPFDRSWLDDPTVVAATLRFIQDIAELHVLNADAHNPDESVSYEDIEQLHRMYGGHYLWAFSLAKQHLVDFEETEGLILAYTEWFGIMDALVEHRLLRPGALTAARASGIPEDCVF